MFLSANHSVPYRAPPRLHLEVLLLNIFFVRKKIKEEKKKKKIKRKRRKYRMENIEYYLRIVDIKPQKFKYKMPMFAPSEKRFLYNLEEIKLVYENELWHNESKKVGREKKKITIIEY